MPWNTTAPLGSVSVRANRTRLQENTTYIEVTEQVNHYFNESATNDGKHKAINMPATPTPVSLPPSLELKLYNKTVSGASELWMKRDNTAPTDVSLTNALIPAPVNLINGYTFVAGGIILQWGVLAGSSSSTQNVSFHTPFSLAGVASNPWHVNAIPVRAASSPGSDFATVIVNGSVSSTGFQIGNIGSHTMAGWYWFAIGPKT